MAEIKDHLVRCDEGFYDMQRYPERIAHGSKVLVTRTQYRQMKNSDPSIQLIKIQPPVDVLTRLVASAKAEHDEKKSITEEPDWQPIGWYAAQLAKGAKDD